MRVLASLASLVCGRGADEGSEISHTPGFLCGAVRLNLSVIVRHSTPARTLFRLDSATLPEVAVQGVPVHELVEGVAIAALSVRQERLFRTANVATSRSGNRRIDLPMRRFSLRRGFRFITCGLQRHRFMLQPSPVARVRVARDVGAIRKGQTAW